MANFKVESRDVVNHGLGPCVVVVLVFGALAGFVRHQVKQVDFSKLVGFSLNKHQGSGVGLRVLSGVDAHF